MGIKVHSTWYQQNQASTAHNGNLISLAFIGFLSSSVSFSPLSHLCFLRSPFQINYLHPSPCLRPCMHKLLQHHVAILCPLWKTTAEINIKEPLASFFTPKLLRSLETYHPFLSIRNWWSFTNAKSFSVGCRVYSGEQNIVLPSRTLHLRMVHKTWRKKRNPITK